MATATEAPPIWTCVGCEAARNKPEKRLPSGWKRRCEEIYCDTCWSKRYLLRAVTIRVSGPADDGEKWKDLRDALKDMWRETTRASNWMLTECYVRDVRREPGLEKIPPMPQVYLYPEARELFTKLPSQSVAALEQTLKAKYRALRYKLLWTNEVSLPNVRYPAPFAVPNQGWSVDIEQERLVVSVRIGDKRWRLKLAGGARYRRQRASVEQIVAGSAVQGELALYQSGTELLCKMVAWLPRPVGTGGKSGELKVRTAKDMMLVALNMKDETLWKYHGAHLPRWSAEHRQRLDEWSDDSKFEQRPVPAFAGRRAAAATKYHHRMQSTTHEIAAQLAGYAVRRRFAKIVYDDAEKSFCPQFPWFRLRELLMEKLDERGIEFDLVAASGDMTTENPEPLADGEMQ